MRNYILTFGLCLYALGAIGQFNPNSETNYFVQKLQWEQFFDSIRQARILQGDSSMSGTGYSDFRRWKSFWELYMPSSGDFNEATEIYRLNQDFLKTQQFKSIQLNNNVNALQVNPVNWEELGPKNMSKIKTYNISSSEWEDSHLNNNGQNPPFDFNNGQLKSGAHVAKIDRLFQHPIDENKIYACAGGVDNGGGGLFFSEDFGQNWVVLGTDKIPNPDIMSFAIKPSQSLPDIGVEYIFIGLSTGAVYRSVDNGTNWIECNYYGTNNYPYWNSNPLLPNSLPYDFAFLNRDASLNIDLNCDIKFTKKNSISSNFSRVIVARTGGIFYSDNFNATLNPISPTQLNNQIQWSNMTDNIGDNFNVIKNAIPIYDPLTDNRLFHFTDFEFCERLGQTYYFIHFEVKEQNSAGVILGKIRQYVCFSTDYGITWDFLGGITSPNTPNAEELDVNLTPCNIEILSSNPNFLYIASPKPRIPGAPSWDSNYSYSLKKFDFNSLQWYDYSQSYNFYTPVGTQAHGFAIDKSNENNWWFFSNDVDKMKGGIYEAISASGNYSKFHHADARDLLVLSNGTLLVGTDGGVYRTQIGVNDHILNASSEGLNAAQTNSVSVAQKSPYYVTAGVWHSGIEIYNPNEDNWHWGSMSDGQIGGTFFLNNEIFSLSDQLFNISVLKNYNSLTNVGFGGEVASSENLYGRSYSVKRTTTNDELYFNNDDYTGALISLGLLFPKYSTTPKVIPNNPDKLALIIRAGSNQQFIKFYSGCNQPIPVLTEIQSIDIQQIYDPSGQEISSLGTVVFDHRKNGRFWAVLRSSPVWGSFYENRIVEFDPDQGQFIDLSYPIDDNFTNSNIFPNWLNIRDLQLDRQTGILYLGTTNGVYYLDRDNTIWRKYSLNVPLVDVDLDVRHCTGEIFVAGTNRGIWHTELIRNNDTPTIEWNITQNETWNDRMNLFCTLVIEPGVTLTIKDELVVYGFQKIIVKPGGRLIVDGGKITTECGEYWSGIEVWGNENERQLPGFQGTLITKNNAIIEYAKNAIQVWKEGDLATTGGIVYCYNTTFKNNWKSVDFQYYHSFSNLGTEYMNKGLFSNCTFTWDDDFIGTDIAPAVTLYHINGVQFRGCDFVDNRTASNPIRTTGIKSLDAGYKVLGRPLTVSPIYNPNLIQHDIYNESNYDVGNFTRLNRGIDASNATSTATFTVDHCKFEDCRAGVEVKSVDNVVTTRNKFIHSGLHPTDIPNMNQLIYRNSTAYTIEGNLFEKSPLGTSSMVHGTLIYNSGDAESKVYRNFYTGLNVGNYALGFNSNDYSFLNSATGLQWLCNENSNGYYDFYNYIDLYSPANDGEGVRLLQGNLTSSAGNKFSGTITSGLPLGDAQLYHTDLDLLAYCYKNPTAEYPTQTVGYISYIISTYQNSCPSSFQTTIHVDKHRIIKTPEKPIKQQRLVEINQELTAKKIELDQLKASGNTQNLYDLVESINSSNKSAVKSTLLQNSPYLSDSLLTELGKKQPTLFPHSWYKEIVMANIEVARKNSFLASLKTKPNPLPEGMFLEIKNNRFTSFTERGNKELAILNLSEEKEDILNLLIKDEFSDSLEIDWILINDLIQQRNHLVNKSELIELNFSNFNIDSIQTKLNILDQSLNEFEMVRIQEEMNDFSIFKNYMIDLIDDQGRIFSLDSSQIDQLEYMAVNFKGKAAMQARNVLCYFANICDDIEVKFIDTSNGNSNKSMIQNENNVEYADLIVIPNPNNGSFQLVLPEGCEINEIAIFDISGKAVEFDNISDSKVNLIKVKNVASGIHLIKVSCQNNQIYNSRILISNKE